VHFAQAVVVGGLVSNGDLGLLGDAGLTGSALHDDARGGVGDGGDVDSGLLFDEDLAEASGDAEADGPLDGPAGDDLSCAVVDERDLAGAVGDEESPS
jgi:hypothetical protein